jgi:hypothetical protein
LPCGQSRPLTAEEIAGLQSREGTG